MAETQIEWTDATLDPSRWMYDSSAPAAPIAMPWKWRAALPSHGRREV